MWDGMFYRKTSLSLSILVVTVQFAFSQKAMKFNLVHLLEENKLDTTFYQQPIQKVKNGLGDAINVSGIAWLKDVTFTTGTIDCDLRGRDVFLKSFLGIAFHAKDKSAYDVVYFCPFRFDDGDTTRWYSVKYMSVPDYGFSKLRKEHPHVYENEATPSPRPDQWFHATIQVTSDSIAVFVNHASRASLRVGKLPTLKTGKIGLWSYEPTLSSDFADLVIKPGKPSQSK